jgi:NAD(P)-dependent dehydrogenase (short-subunit alcohol dehydrogenase family)
MSERRESEVEAGQLEGAVVAVTGGGTGVGMALSLEAVRRGAKVALLTPVDATGAVAQVEAAGGEAQWFDCDIADYEQVTAAVRDVVDLWGGVDVLVNNAAGSSAPGFLQDTDPATVRRQFEINVLGTYHCLRAFYEPLRASAAAGRFAHVLNVGSEHSLGVPPHVPPMSTYTVSKYTSLAYTDVVRRDFASARVGVTLVAPSWVLTDVVLRAAERFEAVARSVEGRGQTPEEVAQLTWDGVLRRDHLLITNDVSRPFAEQHALELLDTIRGQQG